MDAGTLSTIIGGGTSLLGDIFNLFGSSKANREQRQYATGVMNQQRQWAVEDLKNQQEYNSPEQQMARLSKAGLNPNLVYGTGIQAAGQSEQPRGVSSPSYNPQNELQGFSNLGQQAAEAQTLGVSLEKTKADTVLTKANKIARDLNNNVLETIPGARKGVYNPLTGEDISTEIRDININNARSGSQKLLNETEMSDIDLAISKAKQAPTITGAIEAAKQSLIKTATDEQTKKNLEAVYQNLLKTGKLQQLELEAGNWGWNTKNPVVQNVVEAFINILGRVLYHSK